QGVGIGVVSAISAVRRAGGAANEEVAGAFRKEAAKSARLAIGDESAELFSLRHVPGDDIVAGNAGVLAMAEAAVAVEPAGADPVVGIVHMPGVDAILRQRNRTGGDRNRP